MASPVNDSYSTTSGGIIYGGRSNLPDWVPSPGVLKSVHLNDLTTFNPCPSNSCWYSQASKQNGPWTNWTGAIFAEHFSEKGALVYWGGGHGGYDGTEAYIFDFTSQLWSTVGEVVPTDFINDAGVDAVWCDHLQNGSYIPPASHTYSGPCYLPPSQGGGVKGSLLIPFNVFGKLGNGAGQSYAPHALDLATGVWTRYSTNTLEPYYSSGPYGGCFVDTKRNVLWGMMGHYDNKTVKMPFSTKTLQNVTSFYPPGYYFVPRYIENKDLLVCLDLEGVNKSPSITLYNMATGTPVNVGQVGAATAPSIPGYQNPGLPAYGSGFDYCPDTNKFYVYRGYGDSILYVLTPPSSGDWVSGTWTWSTENMGGETPIAIIGDGTQPFTKWAYIKSLKCFAWSQGTQSRMSPDGVMRAGALQLYRPIGA